MEEEEEVVVVVPVVTVDGRSVTVANGLRWKRVDEC